MTFWTRRNWLTLAALIGLASVAVGAFAAHGAQPKAAELLHTAATYAFMHAMAMVASAVLMQLGAARALGGEMNEIGHGEAARDALTRGGRDARR